MARPPQLYARGGRRNLDALWLAYVNETGDTGDGAGLANDPTFLRGVSEFNSGQYFESHETWEAAWRDAAYPEKLFLLALTKLGAAFAHIERGNTASGRRVLHDALRFLAPFPARYAGRDVEAFRAALRQWEVGEGREVVLLPADALGQPPS